jgi:alpha-glucosidase
MYYGEELGMRTTPPARIEDVHDPIGKIGWPKEKGRDGERTPMQWDSTPGAGFSTASKPWLPIPPSSSKVNVAAESKDPGSILNTYKKLIALRKTNPALRDGAQISVGNDPDVFMYVRVVPGHTVVVALNMSNKQRTTMFFGLDQYGVHGATKTLFSTGTGWAKPGTLILEPFAAYVGATD